MPNAKFLFPLGKALFKRYIIYEDSYVDGDRLFRIVKALDPDLWMHLFREMVGGETAIKYGRSIDGVEAVRRKLNLEKQDTAWNYIERAIPDKMDA